jgi:hypothetical protein
MSVAEILEEAGRLTPVERSELVRQLRVRELTDDPARTEDLATKLDRVLAGSGAVSEEQLRDRLNR